MKIKTCTPDRLPLKKLDWESLVPLMGEAHRVLAEFNEVLKTVPHPKEVFSLLLADEAIASVHVDGMKPSLEMILCPELFAKNRNRIQIIIDYYRALDDAVKKGVKKPISNHLLLKIHGMVKKNSSPNKADLGCFRNRQNWIGPEGCKMEEGRFFPPKASQVPSYIKNLQAYLAYPEKDSLVQLAIYFAQLLAIHPFMDGNGRVARILVPLFLCRKKLISYPLFFLSGYCKRHYTAYYNSLCNISSEEQWERWIAFFLKGIIEEGKKNCEKARSLAALYKKWAEQLSSSLPPSIAQKSLGFLFRNPIFSERQFQACTRASLKQQLDIFKVAKIQKRRGMLLCKPVLSAI